MNLPQGERRFQRGDNSAGGAGIGASVNPPAQPSYTIGAVGFGPNWQDDESTLREMYDAACQTIVRLECEADELRAEVALLREEQKILAKGHQGHAKAAVTEGGTGGYPSAERPEPPPHLSDTPETEAHSPWKYSIKTPNGVTTHYVPADFARKLERERDEARATIEVLRDQLCQDKCRDKAAADGGWANI